MFIESLVGGGTIDDECHIGRRRWQVDISSDGVRLDGEIVG